MIFSLRQRVYDRMVEASRNAFPLEACGLLAGHDGRGEAFYELTNADASEQDYRMIPEEQFAAVRDMRGKGLGLTAIWHSHPKAPSRMSEKDVRLAFTPDAAYLVLSLLSEQNPHLRAFRVDDGATREMEIELYEE
jgi:proteasome lid subunit RPN8/RPN11